MFHYLSSTTKDTTIRLGTIAYRGYEPLYIALSDHHGVLHATVGQSVAIRAGSPNYANAWRFIQLLLSEDIQLIPLTWSADAFGGNSINNNVIARQVELIMAQPRQPVGDFREAQVIWFPPTMAQMQLLLDILDSVSVASLQNRTMGNFFYEAMQPFMLGRQNLDAAMVELEHRLRLYLSE